MYMTRELISFTFEHRSMFLSLSKLALALSAIIIPFSRLGGFHANLGSPQMFRRRVPRLNINKHRSSSGNKNRHI